MLCVQNKQLVNKKNYEMKADAWHQRAKTAEFFFFYFRKCVTVL